MNECIGIDPYIDFNTLDELDSDTFDFGDEQNILKYIVNFEEPKPEPYIPTPDFECLICLCNYTFEEMYFVDVCGHLFCKDCMIQHCITGVKSRTINIHCPCENCPIELARYEIIGLVKTVNPELGDMYDKILYETALRGFTDLIFCPAPDCSTPLPLNDKSQWQKCLKCNYIFCHKCMLEYHPDFTCEQWKKMGKVENFDDYLKIMEDRVKTCPVCHIKVEKNGGCNKIPCTSCKSHFCWICESDLGKDAMKAYNHFENGVCKKWDA
jgi:hypothetical protein